jgi:hypothetical protein
MTGGIRRLIEPHSKEESTLREMVVAGFYRMLKEDIDALRKAQQSPTRSLKKPPYDLAKAAGFYKGLYERL